MKNENLDSNLEQYLKSYAKKLEADFNLIKNLVSDSSVKGKKNEEIIGKFISSHYQNSFVAFNTQIIDSKGYKTDEIDICVCNSYQPFLPSEGEFIISEGIDFVVQVKTTLNHNEIPRIIKNCKSIKSIERNSEENDIIMGGDLVDRDNLITRIPYIVFCFSTTVKVRSFIDRFAEELESVPLELQPDALFVLNDFSIYNYKINHPSLGVLTPIGEKLYTKPLTGLIAETAVSKNSSLIGMVKYIHTMIPKIIRRRNPISYYFSKIKLGLIAMPMKNAPN